MRSSGPQLAVGDQRQRRTLRDRAAEQPVGGRAGQQRQHRRGTGRLTEHGHPVGVAAERGDVVADPAQRGQLVAQRQIVVEPVTEVAELESAEHPDPVGDVDDHHVSVGGQPRPVVELKLAGAEHERPAGNPHHHRQRGGWCPATTPSASGTPRREPWDRRGRRRRTTCSAGAAVRARGHRAPRATAAAARAPETAVRRRAARRRARRARRRRRPRSCRADRPTACARRWNVRRQLPRPNRSVQSLQSHDLQRGYADRHEHHVEQRRWPRSRPRNGDRRRLRRPTHRGGRAVPRRRSQFGDPAGPGTIRRPRGSRPPGSI